MTHTSISFLHGIFPPPSPPPFLAQLLFRLFYVTFLTFNWTFWQTTPFFLVDPTHLYIMPVHIDLPLPCIELSNFAMMSEFSLTGNPMGGPPKESGTW